MVSNTNNVEYNDYEMGRVLAYYISNIDTLESNIGEFKGSLRGRGVEYRVIGHQVTSKEADMDILATLDTNIEIADKFKGNKDKTAFQILKCYLDTIDDENKTYKESIIEKFKEIGANKRLIVPFKIDDECTYVHKSREEQTKISSLLWSMDKQESKFKARVLMKTVNATGIEVTQKLDFEEYGTKFKLSALERVLKTSNIDRNLIKVDRFGMIHPIVIKDKNIKIAIDCLNVYVVVDDEVSIIGKFNSNGELQESKIAQSLSKHKAYKHLKTNLGYISKHLRFIAPYGLVDSTEVTL